MTCRRSLLLVAISSAFMCALATAQDEPKPPPRPGTDVAICAQVTAQTRYEAYGYTHIVELRNRCEKAVSCSVWTDVDPAKLTLRAAAGKAESVVTRKGSPSRQVIAHSECKLLN